MFNWKKQGLIFSPNKRFHWLQEYAQCPTTLELQDCVRVYFCSRPSRNDDGSYTSQSGYLELDKQNVSKILSVGNEPILELGGAGEFDEFGSMAGSVVLHEGKFYLYYCGWTRMQSVPYNWAIGLAVSEDGKKFRRFGKGPILGATFNEPYLQACPVVKIIDGRWHMWYLSGLRWLESNGKKESVYQIMHAVSNDGVAWERNGIPIIPGVVENECQTSASVFEMNGKFHMIFSYRHGTNFREDPEKGYRLGYAWSDDLKKWNRDDSLVGIGVSDNGWDSKMICYPHVFALKNKIYMFYCGNYFGEDGFGYAELDLNEQSY